jgi:hypothetical protein
MTDQAPTTIEADPGFRPVIEAEARGCLRLVLGRNRGGGKFDVSDLTLRDLHDFCARAIELGADLDKTVIAVAIDNTPIALCIDVPARLGAEQVATNESVAPKSETSAS